MSDRARQVAGAVGRVAVPGALLGLVVALVVAVGPSVLHRGRDDAGTSSLPRLPPAAPVRVSLGDTGAVAPVVSSGVAPARSLTRRPVDAPLVSWWRGSARAGAARGQTVLTAHTVGSTGGLGEITGLRPGDSVDLLTRHGTMRYRVDRVRSYTEQTYGRVARGLYSQDGGNGRLVLVSAQQWDGVDYQTLVVATGTPVGRPD